MHIQRPIPVGPGAGPQATQGVSLGQGGGGSAPPGEGLRADWEVRLNVSHSRGFVGGAGRLLIHNERPHEDLSELVLYLPAAAPAGHVPTTLRLLAATVCSAKPGIPAVSGQPLVISAHGARAAVTIPLLKVNDWLYVDLTWDGSFPENGNGFAGGTIPLGMFHPQAAVDVEVEGRRGLYAIPARYHVTLSSDPGAVVRLETEGSVVTREAPDGTSTEHDFRSYGKPSILASLAPPGTLPAQPAPANPFVAPAS